MSRSRIKKHRPARDPGGNSQAAARGGRAPSGGSRADIGAALLLFAAVLIAYLPAWHAGFVWDDDAYVTGNPLLTASDGLWRIWFSFDSPSQYFPLVYTTFRLEHALWGLNPLGYHGVNILLHGINAILLWRLLTRLEIPGAWFAAALFAIHPVQVESVAWVTELKNVEMGFFFLLSLLAWTVFDKKKGSYQYYLLSLIFYALALFSKTTACTLPVAILLIHWWRRERIGWRRIAEVLPFGMFGLGMGLLTIWWERYHQGTRGASFEIGPVERVLVASRGVWFYLGKLVWPAKLTFSYPRWSLMATDPAAYGWLIALFLAAAVLVALRQRTGRAPLAALTFFVVTLAPVLGFIMLYTFRYSFVADHYQYLACIGPLALASAGIEAWEGRFRPHHPLAGWIVRGGLLAVLAVLSWRQCGMYRDIETLWRVTARRNPQSWVAHNNLGRLFFTEGRTGDAIAEYHAALRITPEADTFNNLGNAYLSQGHTDAAIAQYHAALQADPLSADACYNLGVVFARLGNAPRAIACYQAALRINPLCAEAARGFGNVLMQQGNPAQAIAEYRQALRIEPGYADAACDLGSALLAEGDSAGAIAQYRAVLQVTPNCAPAHYNLAEALARTGHTQEAIGEYGEAIRYNPIFAEAYNNRGVLQFALGHVDTAIADYHNALRLNPLHAGAECNLGNALQQEGRLGDAIGAYQRAHALQPGNPVIENNLAWVLATAADPAFREGPQAVQLATHASQSGGGTNPAFLRTLAVAEASAGNFPAAIADARRALRLAQAQSDSGLAATLSGEIGKYQAGRSYTDTR